MKKSLLILSTILFLLVGFIQPVFADVGPKPSITITVENAHEEVYYMTLLSKQDVMGPWSTNYPNINNLPEDVYNQFLSYQDPDGYYFIGYVEELNATDNEFAWTYYPPDEFKILVYFPESNTFYSSNALEKYAFDDVLTADLSTDTIIVTRIGNSGVFFRKFMIRVLLTLLIEVGLGYLFGYRSKKEITTLVIVNIITQVLLSGVLTFGEYMYGLLLYLILLPIGEIIVFLLEGIIYSISFRDQKKGKLWIYTFLANVLSFLIGLFPLF